MRSQSRADVCSSPILLQKSLRSGRQAKTRNKRIRTNKYLVRHCAFGDPISVNRANIVYELTCSREARLIPHRERRAPVTWTDPKTGADLSGACVARPAPQLGLFRGR